MVVLLLEGTMEKTTMGVRRKLRSKFGLQITLQATTMETT